MMALVEPVDGVLVVLMEGTCSRHITHGMMKYLGSTSGAVISDSAVERTQMIANEVSAPCTFCFRVVCFTAMFGLETSVWAVDSPPKDRSTNQAPMT